MAKNTTPAVKTENTSAVVFDVTKFKKVQDIVLPTMSIKGMKEGDTLYIEAESEIRKVTQIDEKTGEIKADKAGNPELLPLIIARNLATNQRGQLVLAAIVLRGLEQAGEIKGRKFALMKGASLGTGKANLWEVCEITEGE